LTAETKEQILLGVAIAAASLIHVSIAASQILLGAGILLLLLFRRRLEFPRIWVPLLAFFLWTVLADLLSPDAWGGRAQVRKFFVFLFLPLLYGVFVRHFQKVFYLMVGWAVTATASGLWGFVQYVLKYRHARQTHEDFYVTYIGHRITGFESHWMTFGALQLSVLSLLLAQWFFSSRRMPVWAYASVPILGFAILLGQTRSIWLAAVPSVLYLVWLWRPKMTLVVPVVIVLAFLVAPANTRARLMSMVEPRADVDSNLHRWVTFRTGIRMIEAHPWFGLGPEEIGRNFQAYVPADVKRLPVGYYGHLHSIYLQYAA
jgi:putative inorganic carbon (HCO3(-)) transporter